jgi:hypothetical protein
VVFIIEALLKKGLDRLEGKQMLKTLFVVVLAGVSFEQSAQAYIDPGSGSMAIQVLLAALVGVLFQARRIARFFGFGRESRKEL